MATDLRRLGKLSRGPGVWSGMDRLTLALRTESDEELVAGVRAGSHSFSVLVSRHAAAVYRTLRGAVGDEAEARALTTETFRMAERALPDFDGSRSFSIWLLRLALHRAMASGLWQHGASFADWHVPPPLNAPILDAELALDALPDAYRLAFVLGEVEGLAPEDAAAIQRIAPETHRARAFRARWALAAVLSREAVDALFYAYRMYLSEADSLRRELSGTAAAA